VLTQQLLRPYVVLFRWCYATCLVGGGLVLGLGHFILAIHDDEMHIRQTLCFLVSGASRGASMRRELDHDFVEGFLHICNRFFLSVIPCQAAGTAVQWRINTHRQASGSL